MKTSPDLVGCSGCVSLDVYFFSAYFFLSNCRANFRGCGSISILFCLPDAVVQPTLKTKVLMHTPCSPKPTIYLYLALCHPAGFKQERMTNDSEKLTANL